MWDVSDFDDIHETARGFFLCKLANGAVPETVVGGEHDGMKHFVTEIDGKTYWLTERGLRIPSWRGDRLLLGDDPFAVPVEAPGEQ